MIKSVEVNVVDEMEKAHSAWQMEKDELLHELQYELNELDYCISKIADTRTAIMRAIVFIRRGEE